MQRLRGEPVRLALADVKRSEFVTPEELRQLQSRRQLSQLRYALEHVPYYARTYAPFKESIMRARTWEDVSSLLSRLPVIEKGSVMDDPRPFHSQRGGRLKTYPDKTSGSSGTPLVFPCDQTSWAYRHALTFRCMTAYGVQVGEPYALFFGLHWDKRTRRQVRLRDGVFNRVRVSAYEIGPEHMARHLKQIERKRPTHFVGYPSAIYDFCVLLREHGLDLKRLRLKAVFLTAEPLRPHQRSTITEVTGSRCVNLYGSAEGGLSAFECPAGSMHVTSEATWLDVGRGGGGASEVVVTDMMLRAFPLIRYAIGDEAEMQEGLCDCGRPHEVIKSLEGRAGEPILLPNGRRVNANLPSYIFKPLSALGVIRRYRFVQTSPHDLRLYLVVTNDFAEAHLKTVEREIYSAFGADIVCPVDVVESLPHLPNAKHRDYVSLGGHGA